MSVFVAGTPRSRTDAVGTEDTEGLSGLFGRCALPAGATERWRRLGPENRRGTPLIPLCSPCLLLFNRMVLAKTIWLWEPNPRTSVEPRD